MGHVDTCIVTVATSALIIQYLLCSSPGMDTDTQEENDGSEYQFIVVDKCWATSTVHCVLFHCIIKQVLSILCCLSTFLSSRHEC